MRNVEKHLPQGYKEIGHGDFSKVSTGGFLEDLKTVLPGLILIVAGCVVVRPNWMQCLFSLLTFAVCVYPYFSLHEMTHAVVYMAASGEKAKVRFVKGGAYCALPDLYVYGRTAIACTAAPLVVFSALFAALSVWFLFLGHWLVLPASALLAFHLLGCRSDVHLLKEIHKIRDARLLVLDRGNEQWLYMPNEIRES